MKGKITITRRGAGDADKMNISIKDELSGASFLEVQVGLADFTKALAAQAYIPCDFEVRGLELLGTTREHKTIPVDAPRSGLTDDQKDQALAPHEVDGWKGRRRDLGNPHNWTSDSQIMVIFERWVAHDADKDAPSP